MYSSHQWEIIYYLRHTHNLYLYINPRDTSFLGITLKTKTGLLGPLLFQMQFHKG